MPSEPADAYSPQRSQSFDDELTGDPFQDEPDDFAGEAQWERPLPPAQPANGQPMSGRTTLDLAVVRLPEASSPATSLAPEAQAEADASAPSPVVEWWAWARRQWATLQLPRFTLRLPRRLWGQASPTPVDYRDRISVATWLVVLGLEASLLLRLPTIELSFWALGSPISIPFTGTVLSAMFLAIMAAAGAESVVTVHPWFQARRRVWTRARSYSALPMAIAIIATLLLPLASSPLVQVIALIVTAVLLASAYFGIFATVEPGRPGFRRARLLLDALAYGSALLLFLFVYQTRTRSLLSGTLVAVTAVLLAAEILRTATDRPSTALTYGGIVGLILGQVTWALNYWVLPGLTGGLLLLLIFYLLVGIAQQGLQGRLTRRVLFEFGVFAVVALVLIALVGPGF